MNIAYLLEIAGDIDPGRVIVTDESESLTLTQLRDRARRTAAVLAGYPDRPVAYLGVNSVRVVVTMFACAYLGRAFAPLNFRADTALLRHFFQTLHPGVVISDPEYRHAVRKTDPSVAIADPDAVDSSPPSITAPLESGDGTAVVIFTSGTSGRPKAVRLLHDNLSAYVMATVTPLSEACSGATLSCAPNYHIASVANLVTSVFAGRRIVFLPTFSAQAWLDRGIEERVTHAFVVPTMLYRIVAELEAGARIAPELETLAYGGSQMPRPTIERALRVFPKSVGFVNAYGLTETSSTISLLTPEDHRDAIAGQRVEVRERLGSVGRPIPGVEIALSEDFEILVRGGQVTAGAASRQIDAQGWLQTGDRGRMDSEGYLYVLGRADDMIIRGGENISPVEIEDVLRAYPGVSDAVAIGVADAEWGQRIEAVLEAAAPVDEASVKLFARSRLPGFKCPDAIRTVPCLPRNDMGKVLRRLVPELLEAQA